MEKLEREKKRLDDLDEVKSLIHLILEWGSKQEEYEIWEKEWAVLENDITELQDYVERRLTELGIDPGEALTLA